MHFSYLNKKLYYWITSRNSFVKHARYPELVMKFRWDVDLFLKKYVILILILYK